ncbi:hypothetical protein L218DRAFT_952427 [Marasmius fiardii PR-910]|nr:hypothetical protein L218DRAFT_952427 [Marasmius fiardii PR-910]
MPSQPSPLEPATISLLLQYIVPPSQLSGPLPSHLIAKTLLQRHFFLDLKDPSSDPASYLSWPSPDRQQTFDLLESLPTALANLPLTFNICYTGDIDSTFAHAEIPTGDQDPPNIRMMFAWDADDSSWKYHNVSLMPFPTQSFHSLSEIKVGDSQMNRSVEQTTEEHSYWDSYGDTGDSRPSPGLLSNAETSEDDYWARYSTVHGTADSTRPSPPPERQRHPDPYEPEEDLHQLNDFYSGENPTQGQNNVDRNSIIQIPYESFNLKPPYDRNSPPAPEDLTERLRALQSDSRVEFSSALSTSDLFSQDPNVTNTDDPATFQNGTAVPQKLHTNGFVKGQDDESSQSDETESASVADLSLDIALREAIRGTYCLWKLSASRGDTGKEKELFLNAVKASIIDC